MCVLVLGTAGEANSLTLSERKQVAEKWIACSRGRYVHAQTLAFDRSSFIAESPSSFQFGDL